VLAADGRELPTDVRWRDALAARLRAELPIEPRIWIGAIAESTGVLASEEHKRARFAATSALAVDMESAAVAAVAAERGAPCLVLRAVCDPARMCIPRCALDGTDADGNLRALAFSLALLAHPFEIGTVIGLQRAFGRATHALAVAVRIAGPSLCASDARSRGR
jgi:adenosylhomocysteine nucleosidase